MNHTSMANNEQKQLTMESLAHHTPGQGSYVRTKAGHQTTQQNCDQLSVDGPEGQWEHLPARRAIACGADA